MVIRDRYLQKQELLARIEGPIYNNIICIETKLIDSAVITL